MPLFQLLKHRPAKVLFVCVGNVFRSRMAEAFANARRDELIEAYSAGLAPARGLSRTARRLMEERGVGMPARPPRKLSAADMDSADLIVNLCEYGLPRSTAQVLKIRFDDPSRSAPERQREIRDNIANLVDTLAVQFQQAREEWAWETPAAYADTGIQRSITARRSSCLNGLLT